MSVAIASRKPPALTIVNSDQVPVYGKQGALDAFSDADLAAASINKDDYVEQAWAAGSYKGKQLGIPIDLFPRSIYYNKTLFEKAGLDPNKPPTTGAELLADAKAIGALGDGTYGVWFNLTGAGTFRNFYSLYWQYADSLYNADNTGLADGFADAAKKALTDIKTLIDAGVSPKQGLPGSGQDLYPEQARDHRRPDHGPQSLRGRRQGSGAAVRCGAVPAMGPQARGLRHGPRVP